MRIDPRRYWPEVMPGWKMQSREVSNGHYEVLLTDDYGRQASTSGTDPDIIKATAQQYVLDIERQLKGTFSLFLYNLFKMRLADKGISKERYDNETFGSWYIEINSKRLIFDGRDFLFVFQYKQKDDWNDSLTIPLSEFIISDLNKLVESFK